MASRDPFFKSVDEKTNTRKRQRPSRQKKTNDLANGKKKSKKKDKDQSTNRSLKGKEKLRSKEDEDEEIEVGSGDDDGLSDELEDGVGVESDDEQDYQDETPAQKRLRLAQVYVEELKQSQMREEGTFDAAEIDKEIIASRLQRDVLESTGKIHKFVGSQLKARVCDSKSLFICFKTGKNHHRLPITCVKLNKDASNLYVADKQGRIVKYDCREAWEFFKATDRSNELNQSGILRLARIMKNHVPPKSSSQEKFKRKQQSSQHKTLSNATEGEQKGHVGEILTIDITEDEKILASAGKDKLIGVWDLVNDSNEWKVGLRGHKDTIASISFRIGTSTLYSSSFDRMIKVFNLDSLTYSETLFGHQDKIHSISSLKNEVVVSAGGRDRTCRYWKIIDESQLVFRGGGISKVRDLIDGVGFDPDEDRSNVEATKKDDKPFAEGSIDCVCMVDDRLFLSGGDSGSISLWTTSKKKAIFTHSLAHGVERVAVTGTTNEIVCQPRWITSLYCIPYSDTFMSGSWDGSLRIWRLIPKEGSHEIKRFERLSEIDISYSGGFVNSIDAISGSANNWQTNPSKRLHDDREDKSKLNDEECIQKYQNILAIAIGIGQEHRLGRWKKDKTAKNHTILALIDF
ncbi:WD40-repeat-containing domain protein [Phakopsora pachyrhizi]|nr:WD40-repeat-containing domain protein [Phakopsora pachyrhizi]